MQRIFLSAILGPMLLAAQGQTEFVFTDQGWDGPIGQHLSLWSDAGGNSTLQDALKAEYEPCGTPVPNLGISTAVHWLQLHVHNASGNDRLILALPHPELDEVDVFLVSEVSTKHVMSAGQSRPLSAKFGTFDRELSVALDVPRGSMARVFVRAYSIKQLQVPMLLTTEKEYAESRAGRNILIGLYVGIMAVLVLYNLFIWFALKQRTYLQYVGYLALVALTQLAFNGIAPAYLWPGSQWLSQYSSLLLTLATAAAGSQFTRTFLETRSTASKLDRGVRVFYAIFIVTSVIYLSGGGQLGYQLAQAISGLFAFYILFIAFRVWRRGSRQAGYFLIAWSVFLSGTMVFVLKDAGILPYNDITIYTMPLGSAIEGILLSFGLADRINVLRKEKERSQAAALAASLENERIIRDQNAILEQKVTERTHELVEANHELKRTQVQLVEAEKMAGLGQLTAGIAHEINNPINFINSNIPPLRRNLQDMTEVIKGYRSGPEDPAARLAEADKLYNELGIDDALAELDGMIGSIDEGARRTAEIVKGLRNFSRLDEDALKLADLNEGVQSTLALLSPQVRGQVTFNTVLAELPQAECLPGKLNQAIMNLLTNAAQSVRAKHGETGRGLVSIRTWHEDGRITIAVKDNGVGLTDDVKSRMFEPFFTTKGVGEGTGLGLSITYSIVQKHGGQIAVDSIPGDGAEFRITIPVQQEKSDNLALRA